MISLQKTNLLAHKMTNNSNNYNSGASQDAPLRHVARSGDVPQPGSTNARTGAAAQQQGGANAHTGAASQQRSVQQRSAKHGSAPQQQNAQQRAAQQRMTQQRAAQQRATQQRAAHSASQQRGSQPLQQQRAASGAANQQPRGAHGAAAQQQRTQYNASQQSRPQPQSQSQQPQQPQQQQQQRRAVPAASAAPALSSQGRAASRRAVNNSAYAAHSRGTGGAPYASRASRQSTGAPTGAAALATGASQTTKKRSLSSILLPVFTAIFVVCLIVLIVIFVGYWQGSKSYDEVTQQAFSGASIQEATPLDTVIDWDALRETNPDTIAWIYIPGTDINYPIVQTTNNEKYLKTDFQGETNWVVSYGALFLDYHCSSDFSNQNNFVYGHNMNNGSMFAQIANLANNDTFNETRTVYLFTPTCNYKLESFALLHVDANDTLVQPSTGTSEQQSEYVQDKIDRSEVTPSEGFPEASSVERTFAFVTCDNLPTNGRYVLYCQAVETSE